MQANNFDNISFPHTLRLKHFSVNELQIKAHYTKPTKMFQNKHLNSYKRGSKLPQKIKSSKYIPALSELLPQTKIYLNANPPFFRSSRLTIRLAAILSRENREARRGAKLSDHGLGPRSIHLLETWLSRSHRQSAEGARSGALILRPMTARVSSRIRLDKIYSGKNVAVQAVPTRVPGKTLAPTTPE